MLNELCTEYLTLLNTSVDRENVKTLIHKKYETKLSMVQNSGSTVDAKEIDEVERLLNESRNAHNFWVKQEDRLFDLGTALKKELGARGLPSVSATSPVNSKKYSFNYDPKKWELSVVEAN